jgi:hypothetical protein
MMNMGNAACVATTGDPQSAQKLRLALLPLSPVEAWYFGAPFVKRNPLAGTNIPDAYALPLAL